MLRKTEVVGRICFKRADGWCKSVHAVPRIQSGAGRVNMPELCASVVFSRRDPLKSSSESNHMFFSHTMYDEESRKVAHMIRFN